MAECLIMRRGGEFYELPVLNSSYPKDVTILESASGSATFHVQIDTAGKPAEYTYQWYVNGSKVSGATTASYTKKSLTSAATYSVYCVITNKAGSVTSRQATLTVTSTKPTYTYSGTASLTADGDYHYKLTLKTSGTLKFTHLGCFENGVDVFCVGGGGGGSYASGGAGGYTNMATKSLSVGTSYTIEIGAGGDGYSSGGSIYPEENNENTTAGKPTKAIGVTANGGGHGTYNGKGGSGGTGGSATGSSLESATNGNNGYGGPDSEDLGAYKPGTGQKTTTKEFGTGTLYSKGGGTAAKWKSGSNSSNNTGNGGQGGGFVGSGAATKGGKGGSGIAIIRDVR